MMFKPVNTLPAAVLGACILAMHQVQAAPVRVRDGHHEGGFMLNQYTADEVWFTAPHGAAHHPETVHVQEALDINAVPFKLKPYPGDLTTEFEFKFESGFSGATFSEMRDWDDPNKLVARSTDGRMSCIFPMTMDPAGANYQSKLYCVDTEAYNALTQASATTPSVG